MQIEIKDIDKKDHGKAIQFAISGMHFDWYLNNKLLLNSYGKYFWYLEMNRATRAYGAYVDGEFVGCLLAEIYGEERLHSAWYERLYVKAVDVIQKIFFKNGAGSYEKTVREQLEHFRENHNPDGEIIFLASDTSSAVKGVGTALLERLAKDESGKLIYLHTDDACTYQFYEKRGFEKNEERDVILEFPKGNVTLKCLLYSKTL